MNPYSNVIGKVTGIIVSYNQPKLLTNCMRSIRKHYPNMKIIIIDGSDVGHPCFATAMSFESKHTRVVSMHRNIGHGKGMRLGITLCETRYFALIDSDTIMHKAPLEQMLQQMTTHSYGIGEICAVDHRGMNTSPDNEHVQYLHPHFALINKFEYLRYHGIIHHGAPMIKAMINLRDLGCDNTLESFPVSDYVEHLGRGTRVLNPAGFNCKTWDKVS